MQLKGQMSLTIRATSLRLTPTHGYLMRCVDLFHDDIYCLVMSQSKPDGWACLPACLCFSCHPDCSGSVAEAIGRAVSAAEQERAQLKERERVMQEAEQARKRAVRVTIDLLGRQVSSMTQACAHTCHLTHQDNALVCLHSAEYSHKRPYCRKGNALPRVCGDSR